MKKKYIYLVRIIIFINLFWTEYRNMNCFILFTGYQRFKSLWNKNEIHKGQNHFQGGKWRHTGRGHVIDRGCDSVDGWVNDGSCVRCIAHMEEVRSDYCYICMKSIPSSFLPLSLHPCSACQIRLKCNLRTFIAFVLKFSQSQMGGVLTARCFEIFILFFSLSYDSFYLRLVLYLSNRQHSLVPFSQKSTSGESLLFV